MKSKRKIERKFRNNNNRVAKEINLKNKDILFLSCQSLANAEV